MQHYLIYPQNEAYLTGKAQQPASIPKPSGCGVLFALVFVIAGLLPLGVGLNMLRENILLTSESITIQGRIASRYIDEDDDDTTYHVIFEYVVNDRRLSREQRVDEESYTRYEQGVRVDVEVSRSDPGVARLAGTNTWGFSFFLLGFGVLWILFSLGFLVGMRNENRRLRAFLEHGKRLEGRLLSLSVDDSGEDTYTIVNVSFRSPSARTITGERRYDTARGRQQPPPAEAAVAIFYKDDQEWEVL